MKDECVNSLSASWITTLSSSALMLPSNHRFCLKYNEPPKHEAH